MKILMVMIMMRENSLFFHLPAEFLLLSRGWGEHIVKILAENVAVVVAQQVCGDALQSQRVLNCQAGQVTAGFLGTEKNDCTGMYIYN